MADAKVATPKSVVIDFPAANGRSKIEAGEKYLDIVKEAYTQEKGKGLAFIHKSEADVRAFVRELQRAADQLGLTLRKRFLTDANELRDKIDPDVRKVLVAVQDKITREIKSIDAPTS